MIDIDALNKFLDESNELIKKSKGLDDIAKGKPLCSFHSDTRQACKLFRKKNYR